MGSGAASRATAVVESARTTGVSYRLVIPQLCGRWSLDFGGGGAKLKMDNWARRGRRGGLAHLPWPSLRPLRARVSPSHHHRNAPCLGAALIAWSAVLVAFIVVV